MDNKEILMGLSFLVSMLALVISALSYKTSKSSLKHTVSSFNLEHSNTLLSFLKIKDIDGHQLDTEFKLLNHGKKDIILQTLTLTGRARSSVGDDYGILNNTYSTNGAKVLKANEEIKFDAGFIIGYGTLQSIELMAYLEGIDSKHDRFRVAIPVKNIS